jgi:hypothetical protein
VGHPAQVVREQGSGEGGGQARLARNGAEDRDARDGSTVGWRCSGGGGAGHWTTADPDSPGHRTTADPDGSGHWTTVDPDHVDAVADEITTLSAHIHAATHRLLTLIAEFDRLKGWERDGHRSCAHWLAFNTGIALAPAREKVRAARTLEDLPEIGAAMARGALSFAKVRALTRVATAENESDLLELARGSTAADLERMVRGWRLASAKDEADLERIRHASRTLSVFPGDDGMYVVRGRLDPEVGALLMRAVEAANDALYRRGCSGGTKEEVSPEQRRADALGLLAERAMAVGFGEMAPDGEGVAGTAAAGRPGSVDANVSANADVSAETPTPAPLSGSRAERYQVLLHVEAETLRRTGEVGMSEIQGGIHVSAETSRRLACDASVAEVRHGDDGKILDVGRRTRTIPPAIRRALEVRDRGCVFPGCGLRFTDAHHVVHWADGGATRLDNLALVCRHHHRLLHEEGFRLEMNAWEGGRPVFYDPRGVPVPDVAPVTELGPHAVAAVVEANQRRGVHPDSRAASCRWKREEDIPPDVLERAEDAA